MDVREIKYAKVGNGSVARTALLCASPGAFPELRLPRYSTRSAEDLQLEALSDHFENYGGVWLHV